MYHQHAPQSDAGRMAWQLFIDNSWRVQIVGMGVVAGVDVSRAEARLEATGLHREITEDLLSACELGFVMAANEKDGDDGAKE